MTPNARIGLNVAASYGRSLVALVCGLLAGRWALMALGPVDFGLFGVIGGIISFIGMMSHLLGLAVGRFFAFEVGKEGEGCGVRGAREWFSTAVFLHTVIPLGLTLVGWPIGEWVVRHGLTIPPDRLFACLWVFRLSCFACVVGMVTVPFYAMYTAKQKIAELTVYDMGASVAKVVVLYLMASRPGDWLVGYAALFAAASVVPLVLIALRARRLFPECQLIPQAMVCRDRILPLLKYAGWEGFGSGAIILRKSGGAILMNEYMGAACTSSLAYANSVALHTSALSTSLTGAFGPAVTNAFGSGDLVYMRRLALSACKFGSLLVLLFAVPMALEADYVLTLWLKTSPPGVSTLCVYVLATCFTDRLTRGCGQAIDASGKIGRYQLFGGMGLMLGFPLMWLGMFLCKGHVGWMMHAVGLSVLMSYVLYGSAQLYFARKNGGISVQAWGRQMAVPVLLAAAASVGAGAMCVLFLHGSFARVLLTTAVSAVALGICSWCFVLTADERMWALERVRRAFRG